MRGLAAGAHILKGRPHVLQAVAKGIVEFCQGATLHHGPGHHRIEGQAPQQGMAVFGAFRGDGIGLVHIEISLVDDDGQRDAEMPAQIGHAAEIVAA